MAKYQAPEGYVLDPNTGLYYTQIVAYDDAGNQVQVVTWFNADTGEYRQDTYPVAGTAAPTPDKITTATATPVTVPQKRRWPIVLIAVIGLLLIGCGVCLFVFRDSLGESSFGFDRFGFGKSKEATATESVTAGTGSVTDAGNIAEAADKLTSDDIDYSEYDFYPSENLFEHSFIRIEKDGNYNVVQINVESIGDVSQVFPNIPSKSSLNKTYNYSWVLASTDGEFEVSLRNQYDNTYTSSKIKAEDMECKYRYKGYDGTASVDVNGYNLYFHDFSGGLDGDLDRYTEFIFLVYVPYWDEEHFDTDMYVDVEEPYHSASMDKDKKEKQKPADLFGGLNKGSSSSDEAAMTEAAGEDYSEAPKGSAGVPNYYLGIWMDGDFNFDRASAPTMAFYENGVFEINANFLEGFCNYCGEYDVERKGSEIYLHLHDYGTANGAPATATVKFSDSNPDICYLMDEGFGMMNYEHTAPYEFYRDTRQ